MRRKVNYELISSQECVDYCDINDILSGICITKYKSEEDITIEGSDNLIKDEKEIKEQEIKLQDKILDNIEKGFTSENFNTSNIESGNDAVIENKKMTITLTTTDNQKNKENNNMTNIDLGECENILRKIYTIPVEKKIIHEKNRRETRRNENTEGRI